MSAAGKVVDRLQYVRQTAPGRWLARCPGHEDRSPSLSIRELDDGRVLLHDFGGCGTDEVLAGLGLTMADLFPDGCRGEFHAAHARVPTRDLLIILDHEITVAVLILDEIVAKRMVSESQVQRLCEAAARIAKARDMTHAT
jgi:hypothetical protein